LLTSASSSVLAAPTLDMRMLRLLRLLRLRLLREEE
jgi:hypothetical protein